LSYYRCYAQWLTFYEVLNAVWEEVYLSKTISAGRAVELARLLNRVARFMRVLSMEGLEEVLRTAIDLGLTAYDSSYVVLAQKFNLKLVTEDKELKARVRKLVKCASVKELLETG
jgi:predicted nucleic acid-binding protein